MTKPVIAIHTSDRNEYRRCRRKWDYSSHLRQSLVPIHDDRDQLWFGTGFHFALEDYHGYNRFGSPVDAFKAYSVATDYSRPDEWLEYVDLATGMFSHYVNNWLPQRDIYKTLWVKNVPQVEVDFEIPLFETQTAYVVYRGTLDRVCIDDYGRIWIQDYKTTKRFDSGKLETDPQISAYHWAGLQLYGADLVGVLYQQHLKKAPELPTLLKSGKLSVDKRQTLTASMFAAASMEAHNRILPEYEPFLEFLAAKEDEDSDPFIRRYQVFRSIEFAESEQDKIRLEVEEMLDPSLRIYPNPTYNCNFDCPFITLCIETDNRSDTTLLRQTEFRRREGREHHLWRDKLAYPKQEAVLV